MPSARLDRALVILALALLTACGSSKATSGSSSTGATGGRTSTAGSTGPAGSSSGASTTSASSATSATGSSGGTTGASGASTSGSASSGAGTTGASSSGSTAASTSGSASSGSGSGATVGSSGATASSGSTGAGTTAAGSAGGSSGSSSTGSSGSTGGSSGSGSTGSSGSSGTTGCTPSTCPQLGFNCGAASDGCGNTLDCGLCPSNQVCGENQPNVCGAPACTPKTCADQGFNCGQATDTCGNLINCGTCPSGEVCGVSSSNVCGTSSTCTGLCLQQTTCPNGATTSVSGTVYAPNGVDPLPNTLVYVPNGGPAPSYGVQGFSDGVATPHCACGSDVSGSPLVSAVTDYKGEFTLTNMPVGTNLPLVIQTGRWRRQFTIPTVTACVNTALPNAGAQQLRMPRTRAEGNIPLMAFVTGSVDALECVLRKIGIADTEFTDPGGAGRVRFYLGDNSAGGAKIDPFTPGESQLWSSQTTLDGYDMVFFACKGAEYDRTAAAQTNLIHYANAGGRVFATHYGYVWLFNDAPFSTTASWKVDQPANFASDPETGYLDTSFPKGQELAQWLQYIGATSVPGQISIQTLRDDFTGVNASTSQTWISLDDPNYPAGKPMHYTFNTPVGVAPADQCGKVLFDDFHVEDALTSGTTFPAECTASAMTPQEKLLEFMIFDLGSCVTPPACAPKSCAQQNAGCGPVGDGCGNIIQCGTCPSNEACVAGQCQSGSCTSQSCAQQGFSCGYQGDGCGAILDCGTCPSGTCGGGGTPGVCGSGTCSPKTCGQLGVQCGDTGDGCGSILNCGLCPSGEVCGYSTPGQCGAPPCTPKTCAQLGYNCGSATDGCGNILNCGTCAGTQTCGGGGSSNVCGGGAG